MSNEKTYRFLVGSYGLAEEEAIHLLEWDPNLKEMKKMVGVKGIDAPSYLTYDSEKNVCYAISETQEGSIVSYRIDADIVETSRRSTGDNSPCYVRKDSADFVIVTNYGGGSLTLHPLEANGNIKEYSDRVSFYDRELVVGKASHPHTCYPLGDGGIHLITDLGKDKLHLFKIDRSKEKLRHLHALDVKEDSGPRHVEYHPDTSILYVANEFSSVVTVFRFDQETIKLEAIQEVKALTNQKSRTNYCADIHLSPNGKYLYVSNRGENVITSFKLLENGKLVRRKDTPVHGEWPRNFVITPDGKYLLVANEHTDNITVFSINEAGDLNFEERSYSVYKPTCLCIMGG